MTIFLQIFFGNIILLALLIAVHEFGHWTMGIAAGIPARNMKIRLFTFPQQVVLRDGNEWVSVTDFERYFNLLRTWVPSRNGQFLYVVGGFLFETVALTVICVVLNMSGQWLLGVVAPGLSLSMYMVYLLAMDVPQSKRRGQPWGDTTILYSLAPLAGAAVAFTMVAFRVGLILWSLS